MFFFDTSASSSTLNKLTDMQVPIDFFEDKKETNKYAVLKNVIYITRFGWPQVCPSKNIRQVRIEPRTGLYFMGNATCNSE